MLLQSPKLSFKLVSYLFVALLPVKILHLHRIGFQIKQLPLINIVVKMDKLVAMRLYSIVTLHRMLRGVLVVMIIERLTPIGRGLFTREQRNKGNPLNILWNFSTYQL